MSKIKVLVVDDEASNIKTLTQILCAEYKVLAVKNGKDAIEITNEMQPDVILLDIIMPEMDGYEVITVLKSDERTKKIPVIFISGLSDAESEVKGLSLGASDYISKPFSPDVVRLRIRKLLHYIAPAPFHTENQTDANNFKSKNSSYILLVDDDPMTQEQNSYLLSRKNYSLRLAYSLAEARSIITTEGIPRAIVLDVILPDGNGVDFLREIRKTANVPVLMLTSLNKKGDFLKGMTAGSDNYLTKPYDSKIFISHFEALLRRSSLVPDELSIGPIKLFPASGKAFLDEEDMQLSLKEFSLLQQFIQYHGKVLGTKELYKKIWGQEMLPGDLSLNSAVYRLRKKLKGSGYTITAEYKEGYLFEAD